MIEITVSHLARWNICSAMPGTCLFPPHVPQSPDPPFASNVRMSSTPSPVASPTCRLMPSTSLLGASVNAKTAFHTLVSASLCQITNPCSFENGSSPRDQTNAIWSKEASVATRTSDAPVSAPGGASGVRSPPAIKAVASGSSTVLGASAGSFTTPGDGLIVGDAEGEAEADAERTGQPVT